MAATPPGSRCSSAASIRVGTSPRFCHPSRQGWLAGCTPGELLSDPGGERCNAVHRV
jgi:hypothetical protein